MKKRTILGAAALAAVIALAVLSGRGWKDTAAFQEKAALLRESVLEDRVMPETGAGPAGEAGHVVFLSVCDGTARASVYTGAGKTLEAAWDSAVSRTEKALRRSGLEPRWLKADVVYASETVSLKELGKKLGSFRSGFFRYGAAFDEKFETALLEAELNGAAIYDYEDGGVSLEALNRYLKGAGRKSLPYLPANCAVFCTAGWLCDGENEVHELSAGGLDYGRRKAELVDGEYARELILNSSAFLADQVREDGTFVYGMDPRFDEELDGYNILRHAGSVWALICRYRLAPEEALAEKIRQAISCMLDAVRYDSQGRGYLYEEKSGEFKLGGGGIAVVALTEYMDVFGTREYQDACAALGEGILSLLDQSDGTYYHVLNGDFTRKEAYRTVYYDGEATFALCRLYGLTGERKWLDAAESAAAHFIAEDYTRYKDHWVAYSMNELTKYVTDKPEYYVFALRNAQENLEAIAGQDTTYHTHLELLMATFELYDRMVRLGGSAENFDLRAFLRSIYTRADRQLDGYFFPEYAMYMENPQRILNTFMVRQDGFRVRIDDVQHNIGGYYLYSKNYERLVQYGMLLCAGVF